MMTTHVGMGDKTNKLPSILFWVVIGVFSLGILAENFVVASFDYLIVRSVDDVAFQYVLRQCYAKRGLDLFLMNDYGYGWIYWFPMFILTYPSQYIAIHYGIEWPLIVLPRIQSLIFAVGCFILCYKIAYKINGRVGGGARICALLMPLYPTGAYFAGRFGTVNQVAFFSMLSVWLVIKNQELDRKKLRYAMLAFAVALGTKASAIVVAPMLVLLVLSRYHWKFTWTNIRIWIEESILAGFCFILFASPAIILAPLNMENAKRSLTVFAFYLSGNQGKTDFFSNLDGMIRMSTYQWIFLVLIFLLIIESCITCKEEKKLSDIAALAIGCIIGMLYLCMTIPTGAIYVFMYATACSFVIPLGLCFFERFHQRKYIKIAVLCLVAMIQIIYVGKKVYTYDGTNVCYYYQKYLREGQAKIDLINTTREIVLGAAKGDEVSYVEDHLGPLGFLSSLNSERTVFEYTAFEGTDFSVWENVDFEFYIMSKESMDCFPEHEFEDAIKELEGEEREIRLKNREIKMAMLRGEIIWDHVWQIIFENDDIYILQRVD